MLGTVGHLIKEIVGVPEATKKASPHGSFAPRSPISLSKES